MKKKEVNKLTIDQISNEINTFKKDLFNLRFKKINGQLVDTSKVSKLKRNVARLLTKLNNQKAK